MLWTKVASTFEGLRVILLYCFFVLPNDERETADEKTLAWLHMTINTSLAAAAMLNIRSVCLFYIRSGKRNRSLSVWASRHGNHLPSIFVVCRAVFIALRFSNVQQWRSMRM